MNLVVKMGHHFTSCVTVEQSCMRICVYMSCGVVAALCVCVCVYSSVV